jgi:hypothetical protein
VSEIADCPHCYTRVIAMDDGTCPSCRKNSLDAQGVNLNFTIVRIRRSETLPKICFNCGCYADGFITLACKEPRADRESVKNNKLGGFAFALLFGIARFDLTSTVNSLDFKVPRCEAQVVAIVVTNRGRTNRDLT